MAESAEVTSRLLDDHCHEGQALEEAVQLYYASLRLLED
jgi:hypothetical protein